MTKRERVLRAMDNQETDKVPVSFWFHFPLDMDLEKECVGAHLSYYKQCDIDFIKIMCDGFFDYPNEIIPTIQKPEDWFRMKPLGENHPFIRGQVERVKQIVEAVGKECCTFYNVFCPMSYFRFGTSDELLMRHLRENPEAVMYAMDVIAEDAALLSRLVIEEGGYGFTEEKDYLYQISLLTGEVLDRMPLRKMPDLLVEQDGRLYVHTYSYDYVIAMD